MDTKPFICLIGAGYWGKNLLRDLHDLGALACVCETKQTLIDHHKEKYPNLPFITDLHDLPEQFPHVTAVAIAVPATLHYELTKQCINMGYHVMVEKPLSLHYEEGKELVDLAKNKGKVLMVGHLLQYHPAIIKIKKMIASDMIGIIQYIKSNRLNLGLVRTGENVLWSFAPHDISIILSLLGNRLPNKVICSGYSTLNPPIADVSTTILHFDNQYAEINVNWLYPYKEQSLIIVGDKGMITFKDSRTEPELLYYKKPVTFNEHHEVILNKEPPITIEFDRITSPLVIECQHFIDCCQGCLNPRTDGQEATRVLAVLELAQMSLDKGGQVLDIEKITNSKNHDYYAHDSAHVNEGAVIGKGCKIWHNTHIMKATIGENCSFGQGVFVGNDVKIGNNCRVQNNVNIYSGVICEDGVFFGPNCTTTNDINPRAEFTKGGKYLETYIERGVSIGAGAVILPVVRLGKYCLIGAGSIVTKDVPPYSVVVGNPARVIKQTNEKGDLK